jgi:hypothetical protein
VVVVRTKGLLTENHVQDFLLQFTFPHRSLNTNEITSSVEKKNFQNSLASLALRPPCYHLELFERKYKKGGKMRKTQRVKRKNKRKMESVKA